MKSHIHGPNPSSATGRMINVVDIADAVVVGIVDGNNAYVRVKKHFGGVDRE